MSIEKVRRYDLKLQHCDLIHEDRTGRYIEYADVAGLVEAARKAHALLNDVTVGYTSAAIGADAILSNELARWAK